MKYLKIAEHYNNCFEKHGDNHLGVDWPNYEDTLVRHNIMFELLKGEKNVTLLDFGCGLGHFYDFLKLNNYDKFINYSGLEINDNFYNLCKTKYPQLNFYHKDILLDNDIPNFDYIICNGTFTEKRDLSQNEMMEFLKSVLIKLWEKTNTGISFNVMSKIVDWERDDLFHVSMDEICLFLKNKLSRNFIIRNDYKLYEYTIYVYK
jgi:SAM-dependent methyltransferase